MEQDMIAKKFSLSKEEIITSNQGSIRAICSSVLSNNNDIHLLDDLIQDINLILLTQMDETIESLHETNQFEYFVARVVTNQVISTSSPFHNTYRLREPKNHLKSDDYDILPDLLWYNLSNLKHKGMRDVMYLRFEYGLKIQEIALIKGYSPSYIHRLIGLSYKLIKNSSKI